ncbi:MAG: hypothetical protein OXE92_05355 [Bacteroidetes bacterium]|nr:hypothetical protein [Bacteroidota bacterium]
MMKSTITFLFLILCWGIPAFAQSATVTATISLSAPSPTCTLSGSSSLDYGTVEKPGSGSGSITIAATTGAVTTSLTRSGAPKPGQARLQGSNVANYSVSREFPDDLTKSSDKLSYSGTWAQSASSSSSYTAISGASYSGTAGGAGTQFDRYFRFGGTISGIDLNDANGTYTGTITTTATCN